MAQKGPAQHSHAPLQQYLVGAPMEQVGVDVLGPFLVTNSGNHYVLVAMDYLTKWPEPYMVPEHCHHCGEAGGGDVCQFQGHVLQPGLERIKAFVIAKLVAITKL